MGIDEKVRISSNQFKIAWDIEGKKLNNVIHLLEQVPQKGFTIFIKENLIEKLIELLNELEELVNNFQKHFGNINRVMVVGAWYEVSEMKLCLNKIQKSIGMPSHYNLNKIRSWTIVENLFQPSPYDRIIKEKLEDFRYNVLVITGIVKYVYYGLSNPTRFSDVIEYKSQN